MNSFSSLEFQHKVLDGLLSCNVSLEEVKKSGQSIGVAVSGGADSISLLISLVEILKDKNILLKVITVNHFIRDDEETCGDADFVENTCLKLIETGYNLSFYRKNLERGQVANLVKQNKYSLEEAARILRYNIFEKFISDENIIFLCLAHNKNDNLETIIMRFIQGSSIESSVGIPSRRDKYVRPLINIDRNEIEEYLISRNQKWRTDSTNFDTNYLRNKIRNKLIPFLDEEFDGWQTGILKGAEKNQQDKEIIQKIVEEIPIVNNDCCVEFSRKDFNNQPAGIKNRILLKSINLCGISNRIPFVFLNDVIKSENLNLNGKDYKKCFGNVEIKFKNDKVFVKKSIKSSTELYFSAIIEEDCKIFTPFGEINFMQNNDSVKIFNDESSVCLNCPYPLRIRNFFYGDEIQDKNGNMKKVNDILSDWRIDEEFKKLIPVIEELNKKENKIICILGSFLGFKNWIV